MFKANFKNKSMFKKINPHLIYFLPILIVIIITVCLDILIKYNKIEYLHVSDEYINVVFSMLCTVASLGTAILSIIIGAYSNKIYGFTIRELINFKKSKINVKRAVCIPLITIIFAIIPFSLNFCSTITILSIYVILIIAYSHVMVWKILFDIKYQKEMIDYEIKFCTSQKFDKFIDVWFTELIEAIIKKDDSSILTYTEFIQKTLKECINNKININKALTSHLKETFNCAVEHMGFVESFNQTINLYSSIQDINIDTDEIAYMYITSIQYCNPVNITAYPIPNTVEDIIENLKEDEYYKARYAYAYFGAIKNNRIISDEVRYNILNDIIEKFCYLSNTKNNKIRGKVLLAIVKNDVFLNENTKERKQIFSSLIKNLFYKNQYSKDTYYFAIIAQIFRALYFFSKYETETLRKEYREEIAGLYNYMEQGKDNFTITFQYIVNNHIDAIIYFLTNDSISSDSFQHFFDYFPPYSFCKNTIWEQKNLLQFAFYMYTIYGYHFSYFPVKELIENNSTTSNLIKINICKYILELSDANFNLNDSAITRIKELQNFLSTRRLINKNYITDNFKYFNNMLCDLNTQHNQTMSQYSCIDLTDLKEKIASLFAASTIFKLNTSLNVENGIHVSIKPDFCSINTSIENIAFRKKFEIESLINEIINSRLPSVKIFFNMKGVKKLLNILKNDRYKMRNYTFIDDLAIDNQIKTSDQFSELKSIISEIDYKNSDELHSYIFLKEAVIEYNFCVDYIKAEKPTLEQCTDFISNYKIAEGKFRIDEVIHDFDSAIKYVQQNYRVESSSLRIVTNLTSNSGFKITFK